MEKGTVQRKKSRLMKSRLIKLMKCRLMKSGLWAAQTLAKKVVVSKPISFTITGKNKKKIHSLSLALPSP